jgi:uncharacterized protein YbaR (Trm112 family)
VDENRLAERKALLDLMACPACRTRLDEDHRSRQPRHQTIALRKVPLGQRRARLKGRNHEVLHRDSLLQAGVMTGVPVDEPADPFRVKSEATERAADLDDEERRDHDRIGPGQEPDEPRSRCSVCSLPGDRGGARSGSAPPAAAPAPP